MVSRPIQCKLALPLGIAVNLLPLLRKYIVIAATRKAPTGTHIIFHDGFIDRIDEGEDATVVVEGMRGELSFTQEFVFTNDGCHVAKVSGPDTVTLQAKP